MKYLPSGHSVTHLIAGVVSTMYIAGSTHSSVGLQILSSSSDT